MIHHVNMYIDFDTLDEETEELFLKLLEKVPVPGTLRELQAYGNTWGVDSDSSSKALTRGFPAFDHICAAFDDVLASMYVHPPNLARIIVFRIIRIYIQTYVHI